MRGLHSVFCVLLLAGSAWGQCPPGQVCPTCPTVTQGWRPVRPAVPVNPAIVRVGSRAGNTTDYGSGTIIERRDKAAYVLTCWHTLRDGGAKNVFVVANGRRYPARVKHTDRTWDVAVLAIADPGIAPIPMATADPRKGQAISLAGFGSGSYRQVSGTLAGFAAPQSGAAFEWMRVSAGARMGDSGGPFLYRGRVVGLVSATSGYVSYGPCLPRLRRILRFVLPPYPNRPGVIVPKPIVLGPPRPAPQPTLVPPKPSPSVTTAVIDYDKLAAAILRQIDLADLRGPEGPAGPQGLPGEVGPQGKPGADGANAIADSKKKTEGAIRIQVRPVTPD